MSRTVDADFVTPMVYLAGQYVRATMARAVDGDHPPSATVIADIAETAARLAFETCAAIDRILDERAPSPPDDDISY